VNLGKICAFQAFSAATKFLPYPVLVELQHLWKSGRSTDFLTSNRILHSWPWKKYVKQFWESIIPFSIRYL